MKSRNFGTRAVSVMLMSLVSWASHAGTFEVTNENDSGPSSLRDAIEQANANFGTDIITFAANVDRIQPDTALPSLADATGGTTIDGDGLVVLDGIDTGTGFLCEANNNTFRELIIINCAGAGINLSNTSGNTIQGCWIGTDGVSSNVGNGTGISVSQSSNNLIGGPNPEDRNVISGNTGSGGIVYLSVAASGNVIEGNYIGTDVTGMFALGNTGAGIFGGSGNDNVIRNNVVSANGSYGIFVGNGNAAGNMVEGNIVGLNAAGTAALPNDSFGINITRPDNFVGGPNPGQGNLVSGNNSHGIRMNFAMSCEVQGNIVGLAADGVTPIGNNGHGIALTNQCTGVLIGGTNLGEGNVVAGNAQAGIFIEDTSDDVVIRGNFIGTAVDGVSPAGTQQKGIFISGSLNTEIGGTVPEAGNVIAYHTDEGIQGILPDVSGVTVRRNRIHSNGLAGIEWAFGVNTGATLPVLTGFAPITGTCASLEIIEIYADNEDEGRIFIDVVQATPGGTFTSAVDLSPYAGFNLTATATAADGSTSMFSAPLLIDLEVPLHTADQDGNNTISLSELLRVIQFFNSAGFGCEVGTEDGYNPNDPDTGCTPHSSDYNPQDWEISLSELLRLIQFFNSGGYYACPGEDPPMEDGYCPGTI